MKPRILIIDDEEAIRSSLQMIFEYEGYDCLLAARAEYHRLAVATGRPELLVRAFEADLLLTLREKELDLPPSDAIAEARRLASDLPRELEAGNYLALVDAIWGQPPGSSRHEVMAAAAARTLSPAERAQLRAWLARARLRAPLRDYLRLALDCEYPVLDSGDRQRAPLEPPRHAAPLLAYRAAICGLGPVAVLIGLPAPLLVGAYPAVNGNFFLPTYGTVLAAVSFDQTGTTRIGRYLLNHSFMRPGLVATATSTVVALGLARWLL